jgi:hypothetical protein
MQREPYSHDSDAIATAAHEFPEEVVPSEVLISMAGSVLTGLEQIIAEQRLQIAALEHDLAVARAMILPAGTIVQ